MTRKEWCPGTNTYPPHYHPFCELFPDKEVPPELVKWKEELEQQKAETLAKLEAMRGRKI